MKFAITPCPNDTFSYFHLISGELPSDFEFVFEDIETLNMAAESGKFPVTKLSFAAYMNLRDKYELLDAGAALGIGTGPVLITRKDCLFDASSPVAVPGLNTTAAMLLKSYAGTGIKMEAMFFRDIVEAVASGRFSSGVLIHEGRFVFEDFGLALAADLGKWWTEKTGLPVPLGCICVRRDFSHLKKDLEGLMRKSIAAAFASPDKCMPYVREKAQYLAEDILQKHIWAFVNEYSLDISPFREKLLKNLEI